MIFTEFYEGIGVTKEGINKLALITSHKTAGYLMSQLLITS